MTKIDTTKALTVPCPSCGSAIGSRCVTNAGDYTSSAHAARIAASNGLVKSGRRPGDYTLTLAAAKLLAAAKSTINPRALIKVQRTLGWKPTRPEHEIEAPLGYHFVDGPHVLVIHEDYRHAVIFARNLELVACPDDCPCKE